MGYVLGSLSIGGYMLCNRSIAIKLGANTALLLGQLSYLEGRFGNGFFHQQESLSMETGLSAHEIRTAVQKLTEIGVLVITREGLPAKNKYTILEDKLETFLKQAYEESKSLISRCENFEDQDLQDFDAKTNKEITNNKREEKESSKRVYGILENVLLTDTEYQKLKEMYPWDYSSRIDDLSCWMKDKSKSKKDHYATILNWARREQKQAALRPNPVPREKPVQYDF